jgi:hypothetical protein
MYHESAIFTPNNQKLKILRASRYHATGQAVQTTKRILKGKTPQNSRERFGDLIACPVQ